MSQIKRFRSLVLKRLTLLTPTVVKYIASQHLAILAILVSIATLYFTFLRHTEDFRVYLRFPEPLEVGSAKLHLNYFFSNRGNEPVFIEDVSIIQLWMNVKNPDFDGADFSPCEDPTLYRPDFIAMLPPNFRSKPVQMKNGEMFSAFRPVKTFIDGIEGQSSGATVEPGKMKAIATMFEPEPIPRDNYNAVVICPVLRFFDSQGRPVVATCKGWQSTSSDRGGTLLGPPPGGRPAKLLPISSGGSCRSVRVAAEPRSVNFP